MARGHAQRVDSATVEGEGQDARGSFSFSLPLKPFVDGGWYWYDVVAGDHGATVEGAEWTAAGPGRPRRARHGRRLHHHDAARHERPAAGPARRRRGAAALPRHRHGDGPGQGQGHRQRVLPGRRGRPGRQAARDRAGQPRRVRWLRPRPARERPQGHRDLRDDDGRRRRLRARGHHPRGHLRRPRQAADDRRRPHVQPLQPLRAALLRRDRAAVALLVADPPRRLQPVGLRAPATCAPRAGCTSAPTSTSTAGSCA